MTNAVANSYASVTKDTGISGAASPTEWLLTTPGNINTNALQNFGQVSLDDEASIAKQLIKSFQGKAPLYSYWNACSQGGRQGLKLAQQYPSAYDRIIAAAPAINWAEFYINSIWPVFYMEPTQQLPHDCEPTAITQLRRRRLSQINPFRHVGKSFNCTSTKSELKISHAAASVANASWTGPRFSNCKSMYPGYDISSDLPTLAPTNCTGAVCKSGGEGSVEFSWKTFVKKDMTATLKNATGREFGTIYHHVKQIFTSNLETNEVELRGFRDAGGKMITYHGLVIYLAFKVRFQAKISQADPNISPGGTLRYYNKVSDFVGNITPFYKYYQVPALGH
ncbi:hypothetical protein J7337_006372 [Fusarium musae]|uniref:Carboxylic ester hydrolase n=1 Tax=Fusarium musae TaxID=1042133 RepID=A0A9P8IPR3_9HYPO|nr:hypothetical protein J7337_006372 [Fusarium musae]KAG9500693.1 hypothetical protein J7337_006372 [Fusarium musae]